MKSLNFLGIQPKKILLKFRNSAHFRMFVDIGNVKDGSRMKDNHHKRQSAGIKSQSAVVAKRYNSEPTFMMSPLLLKSEKSLEDLLDDYVIFSEW